MDGSDCRCTKKKRVKYEWFGDHIDCEQGESLERALAVWFAGKAANKELEWGQLDSRRFMQYRMRLEAFLEVKIERLLAGKLTPGTEVVPVARAQRQGIPMFEFRWYRKERMLVGIGKEQIRHYDSEPAEFQDTAFGLCMHLKDVRSGDDSIIAMAQNDQIDVAIRRHLENERDDWRHPSFVKR